MRVIAAPAALFLAVALIACGGGDGGGAVLADRMMRIGEDLDTEVEVLEGRLPPDLEQALNPGAVPEMPRDELVTLPVHPDARLLGSFVLRRTNGVITFFLLYDVAGDGVEVEQAVTRQLDETPWQVTGAQSAESLAAVRFQSTRSGDIDGRAVLRPVADPALEESLISVVYILDVRPPIPPDEAAFELPSSRPLPDDFPAPFLVLDRMTAVTVQWGEVSGGTSYQVLLLTRDSVFDVADEYRERLEAEQWELTEDLPVGFATVLSFQKDETEAHGRITQGSLSADAFAEDSSYTAVALTLQTLSSPGN